MNILETHDLKKTFKSEAGTVEAVRGIDFQVKKGEFVAVVGTSGSGKSTLLHMIGGLESPTEGLVSIEGKNLFDLSENERTVFRRRQIGFVFQEYNLVPLLNAYENVTLPIQLDGREVDEDYIDELFEILQIADRKEHMPNTLSGGEQQRVAIARALANRPAMILADEPTGSLDGRSSENLMTLLKRSVEKLNQTLVLITHDDQIAAYADRIIRIEDGLLYERKVASA